MAVTDLYAIPRTIKDINECQFYHTMNIPGYGVVEGPWDLRRQTEEYLGRVDVRGKRVLEVGTADGFLAFYMESRGADVVAVDLPADQAPSVLVPFAAFDYEQSSADIVAFMPKLANAFWLCHKAHGSNVKMVYSNVYNLPSEIGAVDIATLGCVLLHVRDPFLALERVLRLTSDTVIITDLVPWTPAFGTPHAWPTRILKRISLPPSALNRVSSAINFATSLGAPSMTFVPAYQKTIGACWWGFTPRIIKEFIGVMGFGRSRVTYHFQELLGQKQLLFTVVGRRTRSTSLLAQGAM